MRAPSARRARSPPRELKAVEDREIEALIKKQEAAGLQVGHRRRIPPRLLADRLPRGARRRRILRGRARVPVPRRDVAADPAARQQEARRLHPASDDRALQVRAGAHQGDAEDDDPVAVDAALPLRPRGGAGSDLSVDGRFLPRPRPDLEQGGAGLRRRRLPLPSARRDQSRPISAIPSCARRSPRAATIPTSCRSSMPA